MRWPNILFLKNKLSHYQTKLKKFRYIITNFKVEDSKTFIDIDMQGISLRSWTLILSIRLFYQTKYMVRHWHWTYKARSLLYVIHILHCKINTNNKFHSWSPQINLCVYLNMTSRFSKENITPFHQEIFQIFVQKINDWRNKNIEGIVCDVVFVYWKVWTNTKSTIQGAF